MGKAAAVKYIVFGGERHDLFRETSDIEKEQRIYAGGAEREAGRVEAGCGEMGVGAGVPGYCQSDPDQ